MSRRVLITREVAEPLQGLLEAGGLRVAHVPMVALQPTGAGAPDTAPDVIILTSAAVVRFLPDLATRLPSAPIAAVGEATASALASIGLLPRWTGDAGGEALLAALPDPEARLWYVGAAQPSDGVRAGLEAHGGPVDHWAVYSNQPPANLPEAFAACGEVDLVVLTSPSAATRYAQLAGMAAAPAAVIGATTADAARAAGLEVLVQPDTPRVDALAQAVLALS